MAKVTGGYIIAKALKKYGVKAAFTLTGGHVQNILYYCVKNGIKLIDVHHEGTGGFGAQGFVKVSGELGCMIATAGPGVTNLVTSAADAYNSNCPVIFIGGAAPTLTTDELVLQEEPSYEAMACVCKYARKVFYPEKIPFFIANACRMALEGNPGPVYLQFDWNMVEGEVEEDNVPFPENTRATTVPFPDPELVKKAAKALAEAKRPAMVVGNIITNHKQDIGAIKELADYLQIPTHVMLCARGWIADEQENPLFCYGWQALPTADVIISLELRPDFQIGHNKPPLFNPDAIRIMANTGGGFIGQNGAIDIPIIAGGGVTARAILEEVKKLRGPAENDNWLQECIKMKEKYAKILDDMANDDERRPMTPAKCAAEAAKYVRDVDPTAHFVLDGGDAQMWGDDYSQHYALARYPGQIVRYGPTGPIGGSMGHGLGAWAADGKPIVFFTGDGSFGCYIADCETYARFNIPACFIISNDGAWGMIKMSQEILRQDLIDELGYCGSDLAVEHWEELAKAWGGLGFWVEDPTEIIPRMKEIFASGKPGIINCPVDKKVMSIYTAAFVRPYDYDLGDSKPSSTVAKGGSNKAV